MTSFKEYFTKRLLINKLNGHEPVVDIIMDYLTENENNNHDNSYLNKIEIDFGKYNGKTYYRICMDNPYYIKWVLEKTDRIQNETFKRYLKNRSNETIRFIRRNKQRMIDNYNYYNSY